MKIVILSLLIVICSCALPHILNPHIIADLENKNDYNVTRTFSTSTIKRNLNFGGNYAISNHSILLADMGFY